MRVIHVHVQITYTFSLTNMLQLISSIRLNRSITNDGSEIQIEVNKTSWFDERLADVVVDFYIVSCASTNSFECISFDCFYQIPRKLKLKTIRHLNSDHYYLKCVMIFFFRMNDEDRVDVNTKWRFGPV